MFSAPILLPFSPSAGLTTPILLPRGGRPIRTATSREVSDLVRRGEATLGLRYFADPSPEIVSETVDEEALVVVCSSEHRLAARRVHEPRALAGERWVAFPVPRESPGESYARILERQLGAAGLEGAEIIPIDSLTAQKRLVEAGFGLALVPESSIQEELRLGTMRVLDIPEVRTAVPVTVVYRRKGYLSAAARALLSVLRSRPLQGKARRQGPRNRRNL